MTPVQNEYLQEEADKEAGKKSLRAYTTQHEMESLIGEAKEVPKLASKVYSFATGVSGQIKLTHTCRAARL